MSGARPNRLSYHGTVLRRSVTGTPAKSTSTFITKIFADAPAPLLRAVVRRRGPEPKGAYERAHVSKILLLRLVSAVCLELRVERAARNLATGDPASRRGAVVPAARSVELDLIASTVLGELDGMKVDLSAVGVAEGDGSRQPVADDLEPLRTQDGLDVRHR